MYLSPVSDKSFNGYLFLKEATLTTPKVFSVPVKDITVHTCDIEGVSPFAINIDEYLEEMGVRFGSDLSKKLKENFKNYLETFSIIKLHNNDYYKVKMCKDALAEILEKAKSSDETFTVA